MQDYMTTQFNMKNSKFFFCAVFDGHGGQEAAAFANENLWNLLHSFITMKLFQDHSRAITHSIVEAIHDSFVKINEEMLHVCGTFFGYVYM